MEVSQQDPLYRLLFIMICLPVFVLLLLYGGDILSDKLSIDALKVESYLRNPMNIDGSFRATGAFLYAWGKSGAYIITFLTGLLFIIIVSGYSYSFRGVMLGLFIIIPCIMLNLIWPAKETIVIMLSIIIYGLYRLLIINTRSHVFFLVTVLVCYGLYAYFFRSYYFLILTVFIKLCVMHFYFRFGLLTSVFIVISLYGVLPDEFYVISQGQRDNSNAYADIIGSDNRTAFNNIVHVSGGLNYICNLFWAMLNIFVPVLFFHKISDLILMLYNMLFITVVIHAISGEKKEQVKNRKWESVLLILYISHVYVQMLFEPDLGSYFRHILSVVIYIVPSMSIFIYRKAVVG